MDVKKMDQELAQKLFFEGGTFIFLDVPNGTEFGIDMKVWNTDENFKGIKMIPPGLHFVHYSAVSKMGDQAPRTGFFHNFKQSELVAKIYDRKAEDISKTPVSQSQIQKLKDNLVSTDKCLGPYPYEIHDKWIALTNHISDELANELAPSSGIVSSALVLMSCNDADRPRGNTSQVNDDGPSCSKTSSSPDTKRKRRLSGKEIGEDMLPDLKPMAGTELRFTKFPETNYPEGSSPAEITKHSLDSTYVLDTMLKRHKSVTDFIGEIQFSFVCFLVGHSLEAFEHWKALVGLVCTCDVAITKYRSLYDLLVPVLDVQLSEIPEEFLADIVANNNFVYCKLRTLFRSVQDSSADGRLKTKMSRFKDSLSEKYQWDFNHLDDDDEDDAPVIVEDVNL